MGARLQDLATSVGTAVLLLLAVAAPLALAGALLGATLIAPAGLLLGALAVPVLLLHVLRPRNPVRLVGSVMFWRAVASEQRAATPFKRLRRNLPLVLQLLALAAIAVALARPVVEAAAASDAAAHVLVLDTSASMLAKDEARGATRFEAARRQAQAIVDGLGPRDQATLIAADRAAWTVVPWTGDQAALSRGLASLRPRHTGTVLDEALILAASAVREAPGAPEVHLLSDGAAPAPPPLTLGATLRYHRVGTTGENVGVVSIDARPRATQGPQAQDPGARPALTEGVAPAWEVFASVRNAGQRAREVFVGLERDGVVLAARRVSLPPGADRPVVLEARLLPGPIAVRVRPADAASTTEPLDVLAEDDVAWAIVPAERGVPVGLATLDGSPALERAIDAAGGLRRALDPTSLADDPALRLVVLEGLAPAALPPRDCLIVDPPGNVGPIRVSGEVLAPRVAGWDREERALRFCVLDDVTVERARRLELGPGARALVQGEGPDGKPVVLVAAWTDGGLERIVVGFDLYRSTWPLRASFPIFVRNVIERAAARDALARGGLRAGEPIALSVGAGTRLVDVVAPDGTRHAMRAEGGLAPYAQTDLAGVYELVAGDRREPFVVNRGAPDELRIAPRETLELGDVQVSAETAARRPTEVGWWAALLALIALTLEAWAYHRRL